MVLPINTVAAVVSGICYSCRNPTSACAECAVVIKVDPETGLPPDLVPDGRGGYVNKPVDPAAADRAVQRLLCDGCVIEARKRDPGRVTVGDTATERHARGRCANAAGR